MLVAPSSDAKRIIDFDHETADEIALALEEKIENALSLPFETKSAPLPPEYLAIDVVVTDFTRGTGSHFLHGEIFLLGLIFRPKVVIAASLRDGVSGEIRKRTRASKRMTLREFVTKSFEFRRLGWYTKREEETLDRLLLECLVECVENLKAHTY